MLVLSRQLMEEIVIEVPGFPPIVVSVVNIRRGADGVKVRLGFEADKAITVNRREVYEQRKENANG